YTVHARLVGYKIEFDPKKTTDPGDHDFHIVIANPSNPSETMIVEIPDSACSGVCSSPKVKEITNARKAFAAAFPSNPPATEFQVVNGTVLVDVTGVGFFDFSHHQTGLAPNCIELHPVLDIKFSGNGTFTAKQQGEPKDTITHKCIPK